MRRRRSRRLRWWLAIYGAAVTLPFIALLILMFTVEVRHEGATARSTALRVARGAAGRLAGLRSDSLELLKNMASRPTIRNFETQPCDPLFSIVDFFPQYVNIFLLDTEGRLLCTATPETPEDRVSNDAAIRFLQDAVKRGKVDYGVLTIQQVAGRWMSTMTVPVRSARGSRASLTLVALPEIIAKEALPPEAVVTITDRNGIILARSADSARWVGHNARSRPIEPPPEGTSEVTGIDGVPRLYGYTFSRQLGWYISVGIPTSVVMQPVRELYLEGLLAGVIVIMVVLFVGSILSRRVEQPINQLAVGASSAARGAYGKVETSRRSPLEIATLADAFNEMVERRSEAEHLMEQSEQRLKALSERLLAIQEDERARIARAIHDDLGQSLTALKMDILGLLDKNKVPASPTTERILRTLDSTVEAVQQIAKELRPSMLDDLGLIPVLEAEVRLFEERTGIECDLSLQAEDMDLTGAPATALYRIIQEGLTNVMRHSNASRVEIRLRRRGNDILLQVRDDGRGITAEEVGSRTSLGLIGIRERASIVGGSADFEGIAGRGTIVSVRIPVGATAKVAS